MHAVRLESASTMPTHAELLAIASKHLYPNYKPAPIVVHRGRGCDLFDVDGRRWLDLCAGVAVCAVGHAHPKLVAAIAEQAARVAHVSNYFYNEENVLLAGELCKLSGFDRAFFCNSGAEANEALFKLARRHFYAKGDTKRTRFIAFDNAFHGRTMGAVSLTGTPKYREGFGGVEGVIHVPYGDLDAVKAKIDGHVAAILVEAVQGEGGVLPAPPGFLKGLRELADEHGALFLMDEVQTGIGRLGRWFGFQGTGVKPDAIALAKGLGGGFPIGAMLTTDEIASVFSVGVHGTTYGGNPLACAVAGAVFDIVNTTEVLDGVKARHALFIEGLKAINARRHVFCDLRGEGVWLGCELAEPWRGKAFAVMQAAGEAGLLVLMAGPDVVRIAPSLVISLDEILEGLARLESALNRALT